VDGASLADRIDREGPFKLPEFMEVVPPICAAIVHAHAQRVIHRDLRPSNILFGRDGRLKVADFGISRMLGPAAHAPTRVGSPPYMAPEQLAGRAVLASDIYAIGVIMYEMLTATLPIAELDCNRLLERIRAGQLTPPRLRNPAVPEALNDIVLKAMAPQLEARYPSAGELLAALSARPQTPSARPEIADIRQRLRARQDVATPACCWNCTRPLARRASVCPHCGEAV